MPAEKRTYPSRIAAFVCVVSLLAGTELPAQAPPAPAHQLVITILDGEGALNDIRQRTAREPIIEVDDENHKPIAGAAVLFLLPASGPGGTFANGLQTLSMMTNTAGQVAIHGMRPNDIAGSFDIKVRVTYNGSTADATIHQKNVSGNSSESENSNASESPAVAEHVAHGLSTKSVLLIIGGAAAAGAVAAVILTRGNNSTLITAGTPTIGPPSPTIVTGNIITIPLHRHGR